MSIDLCAAQVARADPDRFRAALAAPLPERGALLVLYAFNLEVARAPWVTQEPLIAQMRLQWWHDAVDEICGGGAVRAHEVTTPLTEVVRKAQLPAEDLHGLIAARAADIDRDAPPSVDALWTYLDGTGGRLGALAGRVLGDTTGRCRAPATAIAAARYLQTLGPLSAAGARPLPEDMPQADAVRALAETALTHLSEAAIPKPLRPALLHGAGARRMLKTAAANPAAFAADPEEASEFAKRLARLRFAMSGRL